MAPIRARVGLAALLLALLGPAATSAQEEIVLVLREPVAGSVGEQRFRVELNRGRLEELPREPESAAPPPPGPVPLAILNVGELSPLRSQEYGTRTVNIRIVSPWGFFPPYELSARALTPSDPGPGNLSAADFGFGLRVNNVRSLNINPLYDYDPSTVAKNIDGEPMFLGTIESLGLGLPRTPLYRTTQWQRGRTHVVRLTFAVGPQFFTPTNSEIVSIEIAVATV